MKDSLLKLKEGINPLYKLIKFYGRNRYCPICEKTSRRFLDAGILPRQDAMCPFCCSLERDRLVWIYLKKYTDFFHLQSKQVLHIAPEAIFQSIFKQIFKEKYITADLYRDDVMIKMDITNIPYENNTFGIIYCSHVLEHVPEDIKAMSELYRVLSCSGWAIINVPVSGELTQEDLSIIDPEIREKLYGQEDHVRQYGRDYINRLRSVGFQVKCVTARDILSQGEIEYMGISVASGDIYLCTKKL